MRPFFDDFALVGFFAGAAEAEFELDKAVFQIRLERNQHLSFLVEFAGQTFNFIFCKKESPCAVSSYPAGIFFG